MGLEEYTESVHYFVRELFKNIHLDELDAGR